MTPRRRRPLAPRTPPPPEEAPRLAWAAALRMLARQPRTAAEIASGLARRGFPPAVAEETIARLDRARLLDDAAVADAVVREAGRRHLGSRRVALQLARRGVPDAIRGEAVAATAAGDAAAARRLLARRYPGGVAKDRRSLGRALRMLAGRGFSADVARRALGIDFDVELDADRALDVELDADRALEGDARDRGDAGDDVRDRCDAADGSCDRGGADRPAR